MISLEQTEHLEGGRGGGKKGGRGGGKKGGREGEREELREGGRRQTIDTHEEDQL